MNTIPIEPYSASHTVTVSDADGKLRKETRPCRVLGVAIVNGRPQYVIEQYHRDDAWLDLVDVVHTTH